MAIPFHLPVLRPCRLATTADIALFIGGAPSPVDGVTPTAGDRIFALRQTSGATAGPYRVVDPGTGADGTWVRTDDVPEGADNILFPGSSFYIAEGTQNARTRVTVVDSGVITVGSTALTLIQEAPLVRTDASSTEIIAATPFTAGTIIWSSALDMRDFKEVTVWFIPTVLGANTVVDLYIQWSDDGTTIPFDDDNGIQQTDFLLTTGTDGTFKPKNYLARLTTATSELVANATKALSYPKKGGSMRFGVKGDNASGSFSARAQRLA